MAAFEDPELTIPWTNTSHISLVNGNDPANAYLNITTFEDVRETWLREIYVVATTVGGATNAQRPIHVDITIIETFNETEVNHSPLFSRPFPNLVIPVYERDLILRNTSIFTYNSPLVVDNEDDPISIEVRDPQMKPYLELKAFSNFTVGVRVDTAKLNYKDGGMHQF